MGDSILPFLLGKTSIGKESSSITTVPVIKITTETIHIKVQPETMHFKVHSNK